MIIPSHCPSCKQRIAPELWTSTPQQWSTVGPWPCDYRNRIGTCHNCGVSINACVNGVDQNNAVVWLKHNQILQPDSDYTIVRRRPHAMKIDGRRSTVAMWAYHPMTSSTEWTEKLEKVLSQSPELYKERQYASVLIYPPFADMNWALQNKKWFDEVWQLNEKVMAGAAGPYPSLRAELSIVHTLSGFKLNQVAHVWPAVFLNPENYRRVESDDELVKSWAGYARSNLPVKVTT